MNIVIHVHVTDN